MKSREKLFAVATTAARATMREVPEVCTVVNRADSESGRAAVRKHRTLFVASFAALSVTVFAASAQAAVPQASADVCDTLQAASDAEPSLSQLGGTDFDASSFKSAAAMFKSAAAAEVPPDVAKALTKMSKYYEKLGKAKNYKVALTSITAKDTAKFTKATIVFDTYLSSEC